MNRLERWYEFVATKIFDRLCSPLLFVLRAYIGWQFFVTGRGKLQNIERVTAFFDSLGIPAPALNAWLIGSLECVGGLLLLAGLCSRPVALLLAGNMTVAYLTADRDAVVNILTDPESFTAAEPFLYLLVSLLVVAFGPGALSVDRAILKWRGASLRKAALAPAVLFLLLGAAPAPQYAKATFAGGCFWCMEPPFEKLPGVISVTSGYIGGHKTDPTYEDVSAGYTGHLEAVEIVYDPRAVSYQKLLDVFWQNIDPTDNYGQFCDKGGQYRSGIFVHDAEQRRLAEASKRAAIQKVRKVFTEIRPASRFYPAEDYHQDYYKKNPVRYKVYRFNCGRDRRLEKVWGQAPAE